MLLLTLLLPADTTHCVTEAAVGVCHAALQAHGVRRLRARTRPLVADLLSALSSSPRAILIEQYGQLAGLITVKDCLKYTLAHEAKHGEHSPGDDELEQTLEEVTIWFGEVKSTIRNWFLGNSRSSSRGGSAHVRLETEDEDEDEGIGLRARR